MSAILLRFGLPSLIPIKIKKGIKQADKISAWLEAVQIAGFDELEASKIFGAPDINLRNIFSITLRSPKLVRSSFEEKFLELLEQYN